VQDGVAAATCKFESGTVGAVWWGHCASCFDLHSILQEELGAQLVSTNGGRCDD